MIKHFYPFISIIIVFVASSCSFKVEEDDSPFDFDTVCTDKLSNIVNITMKNATLYAGSADSCKLAKDPDTSAETRFFADSSCNTEISFYKSNFESSCFGLTSGAEKEPGDVDKWGAYAKSDTETKWFLSQWARLKIYAYEQSALTRPLVKEVVYSTSGSGSKTCKLPVRIYKNNLSANTKTAILIHGGGWEKRGLLAEVQNDMIATIFTNAGYTVFAPYYRLTRSSSSSGGINNCYDASGTDILEDMDAFYDWLQANATNYNTATDDMLVQGNSAGAHLAAYLATDHSSDVNHAVLFYGPLDMKFTLEQYRDETIGIYKDDSGTGVDFIKKFFDTDDLKTTPDITSDLVTKSTFTDKAINNVYIIQGSGDALVKPETAARMCQYKLGTTMDSTVYTYVATDSSKVCDTTDKSKLFMIEGAPHVMDVVIPCTTTEEKIIAKRLLSDNGFDSCGKTYEQPVINAYNYILQSIK